MERKIDPNVKHCYFECWLCGGSNHPTTFEVDLSSREVEEMEANRNSKTIDLVCPRGHQMEYRNWRAWVPVDTSGYPILG